MKRLLCIISGMNAGGAETFLMKVYRNLDRTCYQMDFCINEPGKCFYEDEILAMDGRIHRIPAKSQDRKEFSQRLAKLVREEHYAYVLRIGSNAIGFWDLKIAKKAGAKLCSARSSNSANGVGIKGWLAHRVGKVLFMPYVDVKFAPSDLAASYTFGKKNYRAGKVSILHNAVDLSVFRYDSEGREQVRRELGLLADELVIGHVGRFDSQKNHGFLLEIFTKLVAFQPKAKLVLVGKGELEQQIRDRAAQLGIADKVMFTGVRSDIPQVLSAMDVFVFPSLYEGMPNTVIEAQATGLPCVIADTITREADITGLVEYLPLSDPEHWARRALEKAELPRRDTRQDFLDHRYDIQSTVEDFVKLCFGE